MRIKQAPQGSPFIVNRKNYFSDTQYNKLVKGLGTIDRQGTGNLSKVVIVPNGIGATELLGIIKLYYGVSKLNKEKSTDISKNDNKITIHFSEGGVATWYKDNLTLIKAKGIITGYSTTNPTVGITEGGNTVNNLNTVKNNPDYIAVETPAGTNYTGSDSGDGSDDALLKNTDTGSNMTTYIVIGAIVVLVAILIFKKKKAVTV